MTSGHERNGNDLGELNETGDDDDDDDWWVGGIDSTTENVVYMRFL